MTHDPLVVNTQDGSCWRRRAVTREGRGLYGLEGTAKDAPELVLSLLADLAELGLASMADVLPVPVGLAAALFPSELRTEVEHLEAERARLQGLLADAVRDVHRARAERDATREQVSEPYGCTHCGIAKRAHGRRWWTGVGVHSWSAPDQGQIAERMRARRTVRIASDVKRLRSQVAALLAERHTTNEALDDAVQELRARSADRLTRMLAPTQTLREDASAETGGA
jgi:hypothetical protein